jgi:hypothetical protein
VTCEVESERDPDLSWADEETLDKLYRGVYENVCFAVKVYFDDEEIAADYLGNSVYANVSDFIREHRCPDPAYRNTLAQREAKRVICTYFPDMVRQAIKEARYHMLKSQAVRIRHSL